MDFYVARSVLRDLHTPQRRFPSASIILRRLFIPFILFLLLPVFAFAQQCTLPSRIFLPDADVAKYEQLGMAIDVDGDYMVAGLQENSSKQVYAGLVLVYKLDAEHKWVKIAELSASDAYKYGKFGKRVDISGNTIVVHATEYNDTGMYRDKLYVFEKPAAGEWVSGTETYILSKPFGDYYNYSGHSTFAMNSSELVCIAATYGLWRIEVYRKSNGVFSIVQMLNIPKDPGGHDNYYWRLAVSDDLIALSAENFQNGDGSSGAGFVYEKAAGAFKTNPVKLQAQQKEGEYRMFGMDIAAYNNTVVVLGLENEDVDYYQTVYVFEKPASGWSPAVGSKLYRFPGYVYNNLDIALDENNILMTGSNWQSVAGVRKSGAAWDASAATFTIDAVNHDGSLTGWQVGLSGSHLVVGCPARFRRYGPSEEYILDYYSPSKDWNATGLTFNQRLTYTSLNATDDFFGEALAVNGNQLAISADGDDETGFEAGAVYIFNTDDPGDAPAQKIFNPEQETYSGFGQSIAMGDSVLFVSAPYKDSLGVDGKVAIYSIGKVYVYRLGADGWKYASQIIAPNIHSEVYFGRRVVWSPGYCAVTEFYGGSSEDIGRVHIYKENADNGKFEYIATLDPREHLRSDFFGQSMVMTDSMMVIGMGGFAPNSSYRHSAFVFMKKGEWKSAYEDARLQSSDPGWIDRFGASVSMYGDYIVVGAPQWPGYDPRPVPREYLITGAAYIFKRPAEGWRGDLRPIAKLMPSDPTDFGAFGATVAIDHNDIFIGSPNVANQYNYSDKLTNHDNTLIPGKVYHFKKPATGWVNTSQETRQLQSFEPEIVDGYGASMKVSDRYLYVSATLDDTERGFRTGSVQTMMQQPAIDAPEVICTDESVIQLKAFPKGGVWSGRGVSATGVFDPVAAGPGTHAVTYEHSGCAETVFIQVFGKEMLITRRSPAEQTKCFGVPGEIAFESNEPAGNYMWYFRASPGDVPQKYDSLKQVIRPIEPGYYEVVVSRGGCQPRIEHFLLNVEPVVDILLEPHPLFCTATSTQLQVEPGNGTWSGPGVSPEGNFLPAVAGNGRHRLFYTIVTPSGCIWKDSVDVDVDVLVQPELVYNGQAICGDQPVTLGVSNTDLTTTVFWYRDGNRLDVGTARSIQTTTPGNYKVVTTKGSCQLETEERLVPREDVIIQFANNTICSEKVIRLGAIPGGGTWEGPSLNDQGSFDPGALSDGQYTARYTLTTDLGCTFSAATNIVVDLLRQPDLTSDKTEVCKGSNAILQLHGVDERSSVVWVGPNGPVPEKHGHALSTEKPGSYYAEVSKSVCTLRTPIVELTPLPDSVFVPNIITPNGDGVNDFFEVRVEGVDELQMEVFNRYGRNMYSSEQIDFKWNAAGVPAGVYFWRMVYGTCADTQKDVKGWLHVER